MRVILCLLALVTAPAWAEWVEVSKDDDTTYYINVATISKNGNIRKVWVVNDLKEADQGVMSRRALIEHDCKDKRYRLLSISAHSGPMLGGKMLASSDKPGNWKTNPFVDAFAAMLEILCAR